LTRFARYWLPPLAWMALIWGLSTDMGSAEHTVGLLAWLVERLAPWATPAQVALAHAVFRKLGHVTEYAILAALWYRALRAGRTLHALPIALALSVTWAAIDEVHQVFVPSRTPSAVDVLIDSLGALAALLAIHRRGIFCRPSR